MKFDAIKYYTAIVVKRNIAYETKQLLNNFINIYVLNNNQNLINK